MKRTRYRLLELKKEGKKKGNGIYFTQNNLRGDRLAYLMANLGPLEFFQL